MKRAIGAVALSLACSEGVAPPPPPPLPAAEVGVDSLSFHGAVGGPDPASQSFSIRSDSSWRITTSADWIVVSPDSGRGDATPAVSVRPLLLVGDITDTIAVASGPGVAQVLVHLHRTGKPPRGLLWSVPHTIRYQGRDYRRDSVFLAAPDGRGARTIEFAYRPLPGIVNDSAVWPESGAVFDPAGETFAFKALLNCCSSGTYLFTSNADGSNTQTVAMEGGTCSSMSDRFSFSPDRGRLTYVCSRPAASFVVVGIGSGSASLPPPAEMPSSVAWSPDGTWVLLGNQLVSGDRTRPDRTLTTPPGLTGAGWTPDYRVVLRGACGAGVYLMPRGGGTPTALLGPEYDYATFSPDGEKLLARRCSPSVSIEIMDAAGTNATWRIAGADWAAWRP